MQGLSAGNMVQQPKMLSPEAASFRSPMQFGMSRMPSSNGGSDVHATSAAASKEAPLPKVRVLSRPSASRGVAAKVTEAWGKADPK